MNDGKPKRKAVHIGIDISAATLAVAGPELQVELSNDRAGFQRLLRVTRGFPKRRHFVCEPTGYHSRDLVNYLLSRNCKVSIVNPVRVRMFAGARGRFAKTDRIDADLLAAYGNWARPVPMPKPDPLHTELLEAVRYRAQLENMRHVTKHRLDTFHGRAVRQGMGALLDTINSAIETASARIDEMIENNTRFRALKRRIMSVTAAGERLATVLIAELPQLGCVDSKKISALVGVAPFNVDSGTVKHGHILGGRSQIRHVLFMSAIVAIKHNLVLRPLYQRLRARGKPHRVALVAVMRRLLVHLNEICREAATLPSEVSKPTPRESAPKRPWTDADIAELKNLYAADIPAKTIVEKTGRSFDAIKKKARQLRLVYPKFPAALLMYRRGQRVSVKHE